MNKDSPLALRQAQDERFLDSPHRDGAADGAVALDHAIERARDYLLHHQHAEGYWWGELESNVTMAAEYLLLTHFLGTGEPERWRKLAAYMRRHQRPDGAWSVWYAGPPDLNCTVEAYFALKLAGDGPDEPHMRRAREFVLSQGGIARSRVFTRTWLALFGQYDWRALPVMPPELMLLPNRFPLNIYAFGSWARATIVALLVVMTLKPICPLPPGAGVDELYCDPADRRRAAVRAGRRRSAWRTFFLAADRALHVLERWPWKPLRGVALRRAERWIVEHQEADGSWAGIQPPWVYSLMALHCLGYGLDHPVMARGLKGWDGFSLEDDETFHVQPCLSPVWDTALAVIALRDAGLPPDHPALLQAGRWLLERQILAGGDWQVKSPKTPPGGWPFEFANDRYPDIDDTAVVMLALRGLPLPEQDALTTALDRGLRWLLGMQSRNAGWASFDKDNTRRFVTQIPFCDFGEVIDPPSEDVTAHVVELLGAWGFDAEEPALRRALAYLWSTQDPEGAWFGRWGVNYVYGAGAVLPALAATGHDMGDERVRRAVRWLEAHQNADGGWGEACESYLDETMRGRGPSTASQTAWALLALLAAGEEAGEAARRGVDYLVRTQAEDGSWDEPHFTGTGFPADFMLKYHMYRVYFPLMALGRYRSSQSKRTRPMIEPPSADLLASEALLQPELAAQAEGMSTAEAFEYCRRYASSHYENFTVVSWFLPRRLRLDFFAIYAYCRFVDDLGDEAAGDRLALLDEWEAALRRCYEGRPQHPILVALAETVRQHDIPIEPFLHLIEANRMDQRIHRYATYDDLLRYCQYSANPVGRLVLHLMDYTDEERRRLSDCTCTALQLTNFWQDVARDLKKGRIYIPLEDMARCGYPQERLLTWVVNDAFRRLMALEVGRARRLFEEGRRLEDLVDRRLRVDLRLFRLGGERILRAIERQGYDVLHRRPTLSKGEKLWLMLTTAARQALPLR